MRVQHWRLMVTGLLLLLALCIGAAHGLFQQGGWLYHWQTLASGILAIAAAMIGGSFVLAQVHQAADQEAERLRRRHEAARATLPLTLSGLMEYGRGCGRALRILYLSSRGASVGRPAFEKFELPPIPTGAVPALAEMIEATSREVAESISELLRELQVQDGRLRSLKREILDAHAHRRNVPKIELHDYMLDVADVYGRCEALLDFARKESEVAGPAPKAADLKRALFLMGYHEAAFEQVKALAERRHGVLVAPIETE